MSAFNIIREDTGEVVRSFPEKGEGSITKEQAEGYAEKQTKQTTIKHKAVAVKGGKPAPTDDSSEDDEEKEVELESLTIKELKALLDEKGIEYADKATKEELIALFPEEE